MSEADKVKEADAGFSYNSPAKTLENALPAIRDSYDALNLPKIKVFLLSRPELLKVLKEIPDVAARFFPSNKGMTLELQIDPEEGYEELIVRILIDLDPDEALDALERFDEEWWLDQPASSRVDICVNVSYT